ncbi:hypothetical protein JCM30237_14200 [Halolamina litorea]|uniref:Nucleoside deaminase n=1 Tax=Halolamina litorea TaxID=1515593 RepID=A0ABD6BM68_9EURY|nr:nucleoside deaminase [Halolamina litorea]
MDSHDFDHEAHMEQAIDCAREAAARGDEPYGSVLVRDDEVVMHARNAVVTENDLRAHPELTLAKRAAAERDDASELVMYTSTEPCPMCSGGIAIAGLDAVVYSVSGERAAELRGGSPLLPSTEVFARGSDVEVVPDVLQEEGEMVHREHW